MGGCADGLGSARSCLQVLRMAGESNKRVVFLFSDTQAGLVALRLLCTGQQIGQPGWPRVSLPQQPELRSACKAKAEAPSSPRVRRLVTP